MHDALFARGSKHTEQLAHAQWTVLPAVFTVSMPFISDNPQTSHRLVFSCFSPSKAFSDKVIFGVKCDEAPKDSLMPRWREAKSEVEREDVGMGMDPLVVVFD